MRGSMPGTNMPVSPMSSTQSATQNVRDSIMSLREHIFLLKTKLDPILTLDSKEKDQKLSEGKSETQLLEFLRQTNTDIQGLDFLMKDIIDRTEL